MNERLQQNLRSKVQWWAVGLIGVMICIGCRASAPKTETPAPPPSAPAPAAAPAPAVQPQPKAAVPALRPPAETAPAEKINYYVHTVKWSGETVSIIAGWYTGDIENWKTLAQANPDINPARIFMGNKIFIPEDLLKTREPMPKEFVDSFYPKAKTKTPPSKPVPSPQKDKEEEPDLFGPKQYPKN
ncbi:MAG: hypothetical protein OEW45_18010 [Deltaproteobacteria bacterium]|nr:hypothetical protein [Deltaproteobacteria bacterium]